MPRRRMDESEKKRLRDQLKAHMAAYRLSIKDVVAGARLDQPFISRILNGNPYFYETPKILRLQAYVNMQEIGDARQVELPFETTLALTRFMRASGDLGLLNSLLDLLTGALR